MQVPRKGVLAALGGCLASGIAAPLASFLRMYRTEELLLVRGLFAVAASLIILQFRVTKPGWKLIASAVILGASTLCYYKAMRFWGVNLTMVVLTASPVGNFLLQRIRGHKVRRSAMFALAGIVLGAVMALQPWHGDISLYGLAWSLASLAFNGIGFDLLGQTEGDPFDRVFWFGLVYALGGLGLCVVGARLPFEGTVLVGHEAFLLVVFGIASASLYVSNIFTFDNLSRETASVLSASQVVPIFLGAWIVTGERLSYGRMAGLALSFVAATALSYVESRTEKTADSKDPP